MNRRAARVAALQALYQIDLADATKEAAFSALDLSQADEAYAHRLVDGVLAHREAIDRVIAEHLVGWTLERLSYVDRAILRISVYELLFAEDVPGKVVIDEAVELAKRFSDERARVFINGLLSNVYHVRRRG
ncbi:MAG: transcription antitermination factor NusB [Hydrogenibacillus sp.]|nr:transcription antitermination factor NusB [Hydrogenibacillus sp.]